MTRGVGLLLSDDLLFTSKIQATARAHAASVRIARTADSLLSLAQEHHPACILMDLNNPGLDIVQLVDNLRSSRQPLPQLIGYGSHVDTGTLKSARQAGVHRVLPRSQFVEVLETELPHWLGLDSP